MKDKRIAFIVFILLIGGALAYYWSYRSAEHPLTTAKPLTTTIGWIGPLSGPVSVLGVDNLNAVKLAFDEYEKHKGKNDPDIKLSVIDDKYVPGHLVPETTIEAYKKMVAADHPKAIFLTMYSGLVAVAPNALKDEVVLIDPIDNDQYLSTLNHNIFLIAKETEGLAGIDAEAIIDQGKTNTLVIYYVGDNFMPTLAKTVEENLKSNGNKVTLIGYKDGTTDFRPFLEKGKADGVDSYVLFGYQEIGFVMKQAREMGISAPFYAVNVITDPKLQENSGGTFNNTYFSHFTSLDGNRVLADEFLNKYVEHYNKKPILEWTAMQGYDAANILINAIKNASHQEGNFTDNLRAALLHTNNFEGVTGNISISPSGASRGIYPSLYIMKEGKPVPTSDKNKE